MKNTFQPVKGFFHRLFNSVFNPRFYTQVVSESFGKAFSFIILLSLCLALLQSFFYFREVDHLYQDSIQLVKTEKFPDINVRDGKLQLTAENNLEFTFPGSKRFLAILDPENQSNYTKLVGYSYGLYVNPEYLVFKRSGTEPMVVRFSQVADIQIPKNVLQDIFRISQYFSYLFLFVFFFLSNILSYFMRAFILFAMLYFTYPILRQREIDLKNRQLLSVVLYVMSYPTIMYEGLNLAFGSNQTFAFISMLVFYFFTLRISKLAIYTIIFQKIGQQFTQGENSIFGLFERFKENSDEMDDFYDLIHEEDSEEEEREGEKKEQERKEQENKTHKENENNSDSNA